MQPETKSGVAVLSFSRIARDRRVLRQCALLAEMGHTPHVVAYANEGESIPFQLSRWPVPMPTTAHRLSTVARQLPAHLGLMAAKAGFWIEPRYRWALAELLRLQPRLIIANDWPALVVAAACKAKTGATIHYDTHEFATLEFDESAWWRVVYKPMVTQLEGACIGAADGISTVGPKLAQALQAHYTLPKLPAVVRNIPDRIALDESVETAWPLRILYHGQVLPDRGLEALIGSIPLWAHPHRLTIRGDGDPGYIAGLKAKVQATGRADLVTFEKAVSPDEVMPLAARGADLGVHFTPLDTDQRHFSLPNKLFEYIGAGLAVAVSPGVDLRAVVEGHGVGIVSRDASAEAAADAINGLTRESVAAFKAAARQAAQVLCWGSEREVLRNALLPLMRGW
ncbi:MAG: glycosyltransferase [Bosea sp. (in: a-proteobacteria)]